jgi:WD40 repeat protein/serine/threonine protein kinase
MNPLDVVNADDERFALLLARYSEMLSAGGEADLDSELALSVELRQRLQRALSCLRRLQQFQPQSSRADVVTQIMEKVATLHDDSMVGGRVGRFRILRTLGQGGGGIVFLAFDPDLRREVALKVPHLAALLVPEMRRRFLREARAAAQLDHPNLVPLYEVGEFNGVCFLVSAYCRGGSLASWLAARTAPVPVRQAAELSMALADAVQYVHEHGIYHRDIKPGNVLLDARESICTPRLTDFGLAKQFDSDSGLTANGTILGTPSYMAPEQFERRPDNIGPPTDVYGLGAVLYELLTGRPPFKGATDAKTMEQVLNEAPTRPRQLRSELPRDLETICLKCLEKQAERRYASAAELASELRRFLAGEPIQARPANRAERLGKWMRRHPWMAAFSCFACLAVLILLSGGLHLQEIKRTHDANLSAATKQREEHQEIILQKEQRLRQYHYADAIALARQHWDKRRLDELTEQLQIYTSSAGTDEAHDPRGFEWRYLSAQARILRRQMRSPDSSLWCVAFSPDGTTCATGHEDGAVRSWDRASGQLLQTLTGHKLPVYHLAYSPDGKHLVSGGGVNTDRRNEGELLLWDTGTRRSRLLVREPLAAVDSLAFSTDGRTFAVALADNTVKLWEIPSGSPRIIIPFGAPAVSLTFHPNSASIAVGHPDGRISLCDAANGRAITSWHGHQDCVRSLAFSQANGWLVSGGRDHAVRLWGQDTNRPLGEYRHNDEVWSVAISPDERTIASISRDGIVKLWDVNERRERFWFAAPPGQGRCVAVSPDGKDLAVGSSDGRLWMCDLSRATEATSWPGHRLGPLPREAWSVAFSPDGQILASAGDDGMVRLWNSANGRPLDTLSGHQSLVTSITFSPDGKLLATGSFDKTANVKLWNARTGAEVAALPGHTQPVDAVAFAPNDKWLVTAGRDGVTRMWDVATRKDRPIVSGHNVESLAVSPDGRTLALACENESVYLWDMEANRIRLTLPPHPKGHVAVAFSPDGKTLVSGGVQGTLRFWDADSGDLRGSIQAHTGPVNCLAFAPDGKTLASASFDRTIKLWQAASRRELITLAKHADWVRWLAFSADGAMLATAGHDGVLTIYHADKTEPRP